MKFLSFIAASVLFSVAGLVFSAQDVRAVDHTDWQAGLIISDELFTRTEGVVASEIQQSIQDILPECDTQGTQPTSLWAPDYDGNGVVTRAEYGQYRGNPAPFTCLDDYYENPTTGENNYGSSTIPQGARSAAQLIVCLLYTSPSPRD